MYSFLPFMPNLERRPYLLMRRKRTTSITQANPARPTAIETYKDERERGQKENSLKKAEFSFCKISCSSGNIDGAGGTEELQVISAGISSLCLW